MTRNMGAVAAVIVSDLIFRRQAEQLCHYPRLMAELLAEIAAEQNIRIEIEVKLARYSGLTDEALAATGGDRFPPSPIHAVPPAATEDLQEALDKPGGAPVVLARIHDKIGRAR
jgi:hypothetical protein